MLNLKQLIKHIVVALLFLMWAPAFFNASLAQKKFLPHHFDNPELHAAFFEESLPIEEIEIYHRVPKPKTAIMENGYAQSEINTSDQWPIQQFKVRPTHISLIFTKYPKDRSYWLTNYHSLLSDRLQALFELDSGLNDASIHYSILLQTECDDEFEAMQLFHGVEIKYEEVTEAPTDDQKEEDEWIANSEQVSSTPNVSQIKKIKRFQARERFSSDSTVYNILDRNTQWKNSLLVMDWTGSMYGYGAEAVLWQALNEDRQAIDYLVLFNDGDRKKNRKKKMGKTGGIYASKAKPISKPVKMFKKVQNKGSGGDSPENDMEALIKSIHGQNTTGQTLLLADNNSCIRDYPLVDCIEEPVEVILCGTRKGINHQYINLAWKTGGTIHTKESDITNIDSLIQRDALIIDGIRYTITDNQLIMPIDRKLNRFGYCDRYYRLPKRGAPSLDKLCTQLKD